MADSKTRMGNIQDKPGEPYKWSVQNTDTKMDVWQRDTEAHWKSLQRQS